MRSSSVALVILAAITLVAFALGFLGAVAQERCGAREVCFPDWLYELSGAVGLGCLVIWAVIGAIRIVVGYENC